ncbi:MAG: permease [Candidatus Omnitrophica bacterium]|nr:permease [Candidatus Omnitrophota bacterium]
MKDIKKLYWIAGIFIIMYFLPLGNTRVSNAIFEAFKLLQWYIINHTLACVVPAMFIAGAISTFLSQASVMRYLGPDANRPLAYTVASVSGVVLAVCSCSVLPMFAGIYTMGAGLGPASAFLYSGPAINIMAIFLSARVLGFDIGLARAIGAIGFAFIIGLSMAFIFRKSEHVRNKAAIAMPSAPKPARSLWKTGLYFLCMIMFLVFSDWYNTNEVTITLKNGAVMKSSVQYSTQDFIEVKPYAPDGKMAVDSIRINRSDIAQTKAEDNFVMRVNAIKWYLAALMLLAILIMLKKWFTRAEIKEWMTATWDFGMMIIPLLFGGVFVTGFIGGILPEKGVATFVGGNGFLSNLAASTIGALWYFATLTEIPITQMLMRLGMGKGPALALLLAGPALSLPSILVINKIIGWRKTFVFCALTIGFSTIVGYIFGLMIH